MSDITKGHPVFFAAAMTDLTDHDRLLQILNAAYRFGVADTQAKVQDLALDLHEDTDWISLLSDD